MPDPTLVTVVIPVFNTPKEFLKQALDSVADQTINRNLIRIHIIDDASTAPGTVKFLSRLERKNRYRGIGLKVSHNTENEWVAACRCAGAEQAGTDYVVFLDSDDALDCDYLKKAVLLLEANPQASWAYPGTRTFGDSHHLWPAEPFSAFNVWFKFSYNTPNVYRTRQWLSVGQRKVPVTGDYMIYEYWDTLIRMVARGMFGTPVQDSFFSCRSRHVTPIDRPTKIHLLSSYLTWRINLARLPLLLRSRLNHRRTLGANTGQPHRLSPARLLITLQLSLLKKTMRSPKLTTALSPYELLIGLLAPSRFITRLLDPQKSITLAELRAEFMAKPAPPVAPTSRLRPSGVGPKILFAHTWRTIGGAENVLLDWFRVARDAGFSRVIETTDQVAPDNEKANGLFARQADEYYCLAQLGETPGERRAVLWQLIAAEKPDVIMISGSALLYSLVPAIKQWFPAIKLVDILHNEWNHQDWFNVAAEYDQQLDSRFVISEHWRDVLVRRYGTDPSRINVQHNLIDTDRFMPAISKDGYRQSLGLPADKQIVAFIARLHDQKNPRIFLELAKINLDNPAMHFLVVGDGDLMAPLQEAYPLPNVTFYGASTQVEHILRAIDVLVFTSRYEGYPLGSLEAAATNIPVIAPNIIGFREQIGAGQFGLLYEPSGKDVTDAGRIQQILLNRRDELQHLAGNGRPFVLEQHCSRVGRADRVELLKSFQRGERSPGTVRQHKKTVYLHIGLTKTGSSSIQHFLYQNRSELLKQGLYYPISLTHGYAHHVMANYFRTHTNHQPDFIKSLYKSQEQWDKAIHAEIEKLRVAPADEILLSSEAFRLADPALLAEVFHDFHVRIIIFLRRQDIWLESSYNQNAKMRVLNQRDMNDHLEGARWMLDYPKFLAPWESTFGRENITVVPFEKDNLKGGLEATFLSLLGRHTTAEFVFPGVINAKLSRECVAYLEQRFTAGERQTANYYKVLTALERFSTRYPDRPEHLCMTSPQQRLRILESFSSGNAEVATKYLPGADGQLFRDPPPCVTEPWSEYRGISEEKIAELDAFLEGEGLGENWIRSMLKISESTG